MKCSGLPSVHIAVGWLVMMSAPVAASTATLAPVVAVSTATEGLGGFAQGGSRTGLPTCATSNNWSINLSSPGGPSVMATLISAYLAGKPISVAGTGTCNAYGQEYVGYISF